MPNLYPIARRMSSPSFGPCYLCRRPIVDINHIVAGSGPDGRCVMYCSHLCCNEARKQARRTRYNWPLIASLIFSVLLWIAACYLFQLARVVHHLEVAR